MKTENGKKDELESGYWLYSDGFAAWGIAMVRNSEEPIKIDRKVFELPVEGKLEYFVKATEAAGKAKADKEAKEAAKDAQKVAAPKPATPKKA